MCFVPLLSAFDTPSRGFLRGRGYFVQFAFLVAAISAGLRLAAGHNAQSGIQRHTATYNRIQRHTATYNRIQPHIATYNRIQRHTASYSDIQPHTTAYSVIQHIERQLHTEHVSFRYNRNGEKRISSENAEQVFSMYFDSPDRKNENARSTPFFLVEGETQAAQ